MAGRMKTIHIRLLLAGLAISVFFLWLSLRPVEIVAVHHRGNGFSAVLVKSFPLTDKGKIHWWLKNQVMLKEKYNLPNPERDGHFTVTFWLFGEGYKEEGDSDRLCFDDMPAPVNCIEKNAIFSVYNSDILGTIFILDGSEYRLKNGRIIKMTSE